MLETLKSTDTKKAPTHMGPCVVEWSMHHTEAADTEETPFIEVGAPGRKIDGSPQILALKHPAQPTQAPHMAPEKMPTKLAELAPAEPLAVAFEPWPSARAGRRSLASELIAFHQPDHAISKQYAGLFERMQEGAGGKALLFAGIRTRVGTSTVLLNLAITAAKGKRRLAVVDAHPHRPTLSARLGVEAQAGIQEVLKGGMALEQIVLKTAIPGLCIVPARSDMSTAPITLGSEATGWLMSWLRERFDMIFIDGPALDEAPELGLLTQVCDSMYLVVPQGETPELQNELLPFQARLGGRLRGLVHTHFVK